VLKSRILLVDDDPGVRLGVRAYLETCGYDVDESGTCADVRSRMEADLPDLHVDMELSELALRQLIGNALKYAPLSSPIRVSAEKEGDQLLALHVANEGPGIPAAEQASIFEKFYRSSQVRDRIPGTGMGLTITREIVTAHDGRVWVESAPGLGVRFSMTLPVYPHE